MRDPSEPGYAHAPEDVLADRLGSGILIPNGTFLCREAMRAHLPEGMENESVFVPEITREVFERVAGPFNYPLA